MLIALLVLTLLWTGSVGAVLVWLGLRWFRRSFVVVPRERFLVTQLADGERLFLAIPPGLDAQSAATLTRLIDELAGRAA